MTHISIARRTATLALALAGASAALASPASAQEAGSLSPTRPSTSQPGQSGERELACWVNYHSSKEGYSQCQGSQRHYVYLKCEGVFGARWVDGPRRTGVQQSWAKCGWGEAITFIGYSGW